MFAYILINIVENEKKILDELQTMDEIVDVHILFGEWDMIAKIKVNNPEDAAAFVMEKLRPLTNIKMTSTLIVAK